MRQVQVTVPRDNASKVSDILEDYSSDISSSKVEKNNRKNIEFSLTAESDQVDDLTDKLKGVKDLDPGELSIRILKQESLIEKGQETKGGSSDLSQQEIYSKAQEFSGFGRADWALILISAMVASFGISMNNTIVVIGAMMFAPLLSPLVAASISMTVGDAKLMRHSLLTSMASVCLTVIGAFIGAILFSAESELLVSFTDTSPVKVLLAGLVGSAASFTSATGRADQVAGVAVAIALVPPLAASGVYLQSGNVITAFKAFLTAFINMLGIMVAGSLSFKFLGLKPSTYYKELEAKRMWKWVPLGAGILLITACLSWLV